MDHTKEEKTKPKIELRLCSSFEQEIQIAVALLEEKELAEVDVPNSPGWKLIRCTATEAVRRAKEETAMLVPYVHNGKHYLISPC